MVTVWKNESLVIPQKKEKQNTLKYFDFTNVFVHVGVLTFMGGHIVMMYLS